MAEPKPINPEENNTAGKELKAYEIKAIENFAKRNGYLKLRDRMTKTNLESFVEKMKLDVSVLKLIDWDKPLQGQKEETVKAIYEKIDFKPTTPKEKAYAFTLKINKALGRVMVPSQVTFNTIVEYGTKTKSDINQFKSWAFGLNGTNTLVHQNHSIFNEAKGDN